MAISAIFPGRQLNGAGLLLLALVVSTAFSFSVGPPNSWQRRLPSPTTTTHTVYRRYSSTIRTTRCQSEKDDNQEEEYRNPLTRFLGIFLGSNQEEEDPLATIDFDAPKLPTQNMKKLATALDAELLGKEWFVTGQVNPRYFADSFSFQDPDVQLSGIEAYARGVYKLFDQDVSRAEIISTEATGPDKITCTWRLSGKVRIGPGLTIKPYIVYTDFLVDQGLIVFQEDRFDLPGWDILLSALFPFLIGTVTAPPAPPVQPRG